MEGTARSILHVDLDAFFAAVEQMDRPELRGKPVLVGGTSLRAVVSTASYEARPYGCRSAMPMSMARRLCPQAIVVKPRFQRYRELSDRMFRILEDFTPIIQPVSIDEAFLDLTGSERLLGPAEGVARQIRQRVSKEVGITISVGVSINKFLAKLASDLNKPDGLTIIQHADIDRILTPLPISRIWGIGPKTTTRLNDLGLRTIGDLRKLKLKQLIERCGSEGARYHHLSWGRDDRPVTPDSKAKSIGQEQTFGEDLNEPEELRAILLGQVEHVAGRLRRHGLRARGITLKLRDGAFRTITRARRFEEPSDLTQVLWETAREIFDAWARESFKPLRLLGVQANGLTTDAEQLGLFEDATRKKLRQVDEAVDQINRRLGRRAIRRGHVAGWDDH